MRVYITFTAACTLTCTDRMKKGAIDYRDEGQHLLSGTTASICIYRRFKMLFLPSFNTISTK